MALQRAYHTFKIRCFHPKENLCQIHNIRRNHHHVADVSTLLSNQFTDLAEHTADIIRVDCHGIVLVTEDLLIFLEYRLLRHDSKQLVLLVRDRNKTNFGGDKHCCRFLNPCILTDGLNSCIHELHHFSLCKLFSGPCIVPEKFLKQKLFGQNTHKLLSVHYRKREKSLLVDNLHCLFYRILHADTRQLTERHHNCFYTHNQYLLSAFLL